MWIDHFRVMKHEKTFYFSFWALYLIIVYSCKNILYIYIKAFKRLMKSLNWFACKVIFPCYFFDVELKDKASLILWSIKVKVTLSNSSVTWIGCHHNLLLFYEFYVQYQCTWGVCYWSFNWYLRQNYL